MSELIGKYRPEQPVITGFAQVSGFGGTEATTNGLLDGKTAIGKHDNLQIPGVSVAAPAQFDASTFPFIADLDPKFLRRTSRFGLMTMGLIVEAGLHAKVLDGDYKLIPHFDPQEASVAFGSGVGSSIYLVRNADVLRDPENKDRKIGPFEALHSLPEGPHSNAALRINAIGPCDYESAACATSLYSMEHGFNRLMSGQAQIVFAGGAELVLEEPVLALGEFKSFKALTHSEDPNNASIPFSKQRSGFVMGEGGGVVVMETLASALKREATIYAVVDSIRKGLGAGGSSTDMATDRIASLISKVARGREIDAIFAHATSTQVGDIAEATAIRQALGKDHPIADVTSVKSGVGHALGGAGILSVIAGVRAIHEGVIPPTRVGEGIDPQIVDQGVNVVTEAKVKQINTAIVEAFGFHGHNVVGALTSL